MGIDRAAGESRPESFTDVALDGMPAPAVDDVAPKVTRRSRSGTSRAARKANAAGADKAPRKPRTPRRDPLGKRMAQLYTTAGIGASMAGQATGSAGAAAAGLALVEHAAACGAAWESLARDNPRIAEALERMLTVSTAGALFAAHVPILFAVAEGAGKLPAGFMPAPVPEQAAA